VNDAAGAGEAGNSSARARATSRGRRGIGDLEIALLIFVLSFAYFGLTLNRTFDLRDEGYIYYGVKKVAEGAVPHRDFVCLYGPGVYALSAAAYRLFGDEIMGVRILLAAIRAGAVVLAFALGRCIAPRRFALLGAALAAAYWGRVIWNLHTPYAALYSVPLGMVAPLVLLRAMSRNSLGWFAAAGAAAGMGILFKQSLGLVVGYGLMLAIGASAMLRSTSGRDGPQTFAPGRPLRASTLRSDPIRTALLALWLLGGVAITAPFVAMMSAFDYALHFLPLHVLMLMLGVHFARFGDGRAARALAQPRLLSFGAGLATPPLIVALAYASWGALPELVYEMFVFPSHFDLESYYLPVKQPPTLSTGVLLCSIAIACGGLLLVGRRWVVAGAVLAPTAALAAYLFHSISDGIELAVHVGVMSGVLPACVSYAALTILAKRLRATPAAETQRWMEITIAILFFQLMMSFQIFPRATYNVTLILGTLAPITAMLLHRLTILAGREKSPARRWAATAVAALLPLALVFHIVFDNIAKSSVDEAAHTRITRPGARGIQVVKGFYIDDEIASFEWALDYIDRTSPPEAPIGLLTNEFMVHVLSGHPDLFSEYAYYLFLFGWDFLPDQYKERMPEEALIARLANTPDAVLLDKDDFASANLRRHYPGLFQYVADHFQIEYRVGSYQVLRRKPS